METDGFDLYLDFRPSEGEPSRVFHVMAEVIDSLQDLDSDLARIISPYYQPTLVLDDVVSGSIRAKIRDIVKDIPDDALKEANFKKIFGHFLHKAKYRILKWCEENNEIESIEQIRALESEIISVAVETDAKHLPAYSSIETRALLTHINTIQMALKRLDDQDQLEYRSEFGTAKFNGNLAISHQIIRDVLTREVITSEGIRVVKVKKPDYLGNSKWGLRYQGHSVEAKIRHSEWLAKFQSKDVIVQPGDSLKVNLRQEISYGYEGEVVHITYEILEVLEEIAAPRLIQGTIFRDDF